MMIGKERKVKRGVLIDPARMEGLAERNVGERRDSPHLHARFQRVGDSVEGGAAIGVGVILRGGF